RTPIDAPPKPTSELSGFAAPAVAAPAVAAASTCGKYVPGFCRSGPQSRQYHHLQHSLISGAVGSQMILDKRYTTRSV
ncbi:hypothetical protein Tco_1208832, partial [Tanacetum coccineum]